MRGQADRLNGAREGSCAEGTDEDEGEGVLTVEEGGG